MIKMSQSNIRKWKIRNELSNEKCVNHVINVLYCHNIDNYEFTFLDKQIDEEYISKKSLLITYAHSSYYLCLNPQGTFLSVYQQNNMNKNIRKIKDYVGHDCWIKAIGDIVKYEGGTK